MKYDHKIKVNGKYYETGEEVPDVTSSSKIEEPIKQEEKKPSVGNGNNSTVPQPKPPVQAVYAAVKPQPKPSK